MTVPAKSTSIALRSATNLTEGEGDARFAVTPTSISFSGLSTSGPLPPAVIRLIAQYCCPPPYLAQQALGLEATHKPNGPL
jgi:hypothetical protein